MNKRKEFSKYMIKQLATISVLPFLGILGYRLSNKKVFLVISLLIYFGVIVFSMLKFFQNKK